jgi:3-carboxy-cis,cis-muconate cycloisomerase
VTAHEGPQDLIRRQFGPNAANYATSAVHAKGASLGRIVELLEPEPNWRLLDIAAAAGHTGFAFAPQVAEVVISDLLEEMLTVARTRSTELGLTNVSFELADAEADTIQVARTYGQAAVPSSFGAQVAAWGWPLLRLLERLGPLRRQVLLVSLSGAAGTSSQLGHDPVELRSALAEALGLGDPGASWHTDRSSIVELSQWLASLSSCTGKVGTDVLIGARSDVGELRLSGAGNSSTMPQKQNPVAASILVALARFAPAQAAILTQPHSEARDGAAWFAEWLTLPPLAMAAARAAALLGETLDALTPDRAAMAARIDAAHGTLHAEALSFALAPSLGRPQAQAEVKRLTREAMETGTGLPDLVARAYPDVALPARPDAGKAPIEAHAFAIMVRATL